MTAERIPDVAVEFRNVSYRLNGREIVAGVTLSLRAGEVLALLGESGAGKTTVLRLANRLLTQSAGEVLVQNRPTRDWDVAAGHAIVVAAGGDIRRADGSSLVYGSPDGLIPDFIARGDPSQP